MIIRTKRLARCAVGCMNKTPPTTEADGDELERLFRQIVAAFDGLLAQFLTEVPLERPLACGPGCHTCCNQPEVTASALEVLVVARAVRAALDADALAALKAATASARDRHAAAEVFLCPLLKDGLCSIYEWRPLVCRGGNSYDKSACVQAVENAYNTVEVPVYGPQVDIAARTLQALRNAIGQTGRDDRVFDFASALSLALDDDTVENRWRAGEAVFDQALSRLAD